MWLAARADAEGVRLDYFKRVVEKDPPTPPADPAGLLAAKLAFFWCFQYEQQRRYLAGRAAEHEREADVYLAVGAFAVFLQSLAAAGGGVLGAQDRRFMWLTAAATLGPAFAAFATSREAIRQNRVRAERFRGIDEALSEAGERLSEVERAVGNGDPEPLKALVAAVHEPLAGEIPPVPGGRGRGQGRARQAERDARGQRQGAQRAGRPAERLSGPAAPQSRGVAQAC